MTVSGNTLRAGYFLCGEEHDKKRLGGEGFAGARSLKHTVHRGGEGVAMGGFSVAGVARWDFLSPHVLTEQETESWQEVRPGYRRHFPKVTQASKIAKAAGRRPNVHTRGTMGDISFQTTSPLLLFFVGFPTITKSILPNLPGVDHRIEPCVI